MCIYIYAYTISSSTWLQQRTSYTPPLHLQQSQGTWPSADIDASSAAGDGGVEGDDVGLNLVELVETTSDGYNYCLSMKNGQL